MSLVFDEYGRPFVIIRVRAGHSALAELHEYGHVLKRHCTVLLPASPASSGQTVQLAVHSCIHSLQEQEKMQRLRGIDAQKANIQAAKAVARILRSSLGPKGMDKMLQSGDGDVCISESPPIVPSSSVLEAAALIPMHHGLSRPVHNSAGVLTASAQSAESNVLNIEGSTIWVVCSPWGVLLISLPIP